jgi:hypothetical protein
MKRNLARALVLAAAMAAGTSVFAQVTINGYYRAGAKQTIDANSKSSLAFTDRIRLNLSYAAADDMFGFKARLQADSSGTTSGFQNLFLNGVSSTISGTTITNAVSAPSVLKYGYAYGKLFDGVLKLSAGKLDITDYAVYESTGNYYLGLVSTESPVLGTYLLGAQSGNTTGFAAQTWLVEGLSVAATARVDGSDLAVHHFGVDAYYLIPGFGKAIVASQFGSYSATAASASDDFSKSYVSGGFQYTGFAGLSATAAVRYNGADKNAIGAVAIVEYSKGPLFANVSTDLDFTNAQTYVEGEVSYLVIPQLKVRAYGAYDDKASNKALTLDKVAYDTTVLGAELSCPIGKGEIMAGVRYGDKSNLQFPIIVKANF